MMHEYYKRNAILREMGYWSYKAYLASELWANIRARVLQRDGFRCVVCGQPATQAHHKSYTRPTMAGKDITRIVSVCRDCHASMEFDESGGKRSIRDANARTYQLAVFGEATAQPSEAELPKGEYERAVYHATHGLHRPKGFNHKRWMKLLRKLRDRMNRDRVRQMRR